MREILREIRREVDRAFNKLANVLVQHAHISTGPDESYFMTATGVDDEDGFIDVELFQQYGFTSRPPVGAELLMACPGAVSTEAVAFSSQDRAHRPSVESEEVVVYGKKTASGQPTVKLAPDGTVTVTSGGATPGTVVMNPDGSISVTPGAGKTVDIGGSSDAQLLGGVVKNTMSAFFSALASATFMPGTAPLLATAANTASGALSSWSSTKAKVG